ncbi:MAG: hypothetical protein U0R50_11185 [Gaiellales bacterium]
MRRLLLGIAIAAALTAATGAGALAVHELRSTPTPPAVRSTPTPAQLAARRRLVHELETYGCACQHREPPTRNAPTPAP